MCPMSVIAKPLRGPWPGIWSKRHEGEKIWISEQKAIISLHSIYIHSFYNRNKVCLLQDTHSVFTCKFSSGGLSLQRPGFDLWPVHVRFVVDKVAQRQFSVRGLRFCPVSIIRQRSLLAATLNTIGRSLQNSKQSSLVLCETSGFRCGVVEAFALLGPYGTYNGLEAIRGALSRRVSSHRWARRSRQTLRPVIICIRHITNIQSTRANVVSFCLP